MQFDLLPSTEEEEKEKKKQREAEEEEDEEEEKVSEEKWKKQVEECKQQYEITIQEMEKQKVVQVEEKEKKLEECKNHYEILLAEWQSKMDREVEKRFKEKLIEVEAKMEKDRHELEIRNQTELRKLVEEKNKELEIQKQLVQEELAHRHKELEIKLLQCRQEVEGELEKSHKDLQELKQVKDDLDKEVQRLHSEVQKAEKNMADQKNQWQGECDSLKQAVQRERLILRAKSKEKEEVEETLVRLQKQSQEVELQKESQLAQLKQVEEERRLIETAILKANASPAKSAIICGESVFLKNNKPTSFQWRGHSLDPTLATFDQATGQLQTYRCGIVSILIQQDVKVWKVLKFVIKEREPAQSESRESKSIIKGVKFEEKLNQVVPSTRSSWNSNPSPDTWWVKPEEDTQLRRLAVRLPPSQSVSHLPLQRSLHPETQPQRWFLLGQRDYIRMDDRFLAEIPLDYAKKFLLPHLVGL